MRNQIAHHEASHAALAIFYRVGIPNNGIDLNAPTSVPGAQGHAGVNLIDLAYSDPNELMMDMAKNLAIICAGAASDAKLTGQDLKEALLHQPGDLGAARALAAQYPDLSTPPDRWEAIDVGLELAQRRLDNDEIWAVVEHIAQACLAAPDGKLSATEIRRIAAPLLTITA